ncbi:TonB-dependent receptor [Roseateles saccharophilus]|uniref:Outer membrane receptor protein involved in Fe transport n=1 Tax=Roseateles saccharophilus TaxID=304 RepID=A0A4R3VN45_ROSSA|nr:TonB-dependent receptor [Roseateles saccharophilus]MDG0832893.1 TonB-dependent receptor [Roseateles saccharophilus]TCV04565.1 outer membrane receptor protein involved in Fe transport [Roseateles saccharophilus]
MRTTRRAPALLALAAGALCVSSAWAQSAPQAPGAAASQADRGNDDLNKLDTVVVTSQRREQVISKVPMSVAAMNAVALEKQSVRDLTDISRATPGLTLSSPDPSGESNISIRGISSLVGAATTGIYIDDVPVQIANIEGCPILCAGDPTPKLFDLDRVEVLRGPQGTLYGSSSEGGAVRFITAAPKLRGELTGLAHTEVAGWQGGAPSAEAGVVLDAPLATDLAGFRLSLWQRHEGGYVDAYSPTTGDLVKRNVNASNSRVARLAVKFTPTDELTLTPSYYYQDVKRADRATYAESLGLDKTNANIAQPNHDRFGIAALTADYDFNAFNLKGIVSHLKRTEDRTDDYSNFGEGREILNQLMVPAGFPIAALDQPLPTKKGMGTANSLTRNTQNTWTEEIRLTSKDSKEARLSWIAGAYFQVARQGFAEYIYENVAAVSSVYDALWGGGGSLYDPNDPLGNVSYTEDDHYKTTEQALYGEASYKLMPSLTASLGLRLTRITNSFDSTLGGWWSGGPARYTGSGQEHPVTPKVGLSYQATQDSLYYATVSKGFRSGGVNASLATNPTCQTDLNNLGGTNVEPLLYKSDSVWSYELGSKQTLADGAAQLSGSLYLIRWSNVQTQVELPTCGFGYIANMGAATSKGFDMELQVKASKALTLSASLGYDKAEYSQSVTNAGFTLGLSPVQYLVKSGDALPTPRWTAALGAEYGWQLGSVGAAFVRADYQFASGYARIGSEGTQGYDPDTRMVNALHLLNLRAGLKSGAWDYSLYVKNALNTRTEMSRFHSFSQSAITGQPSQLYYGTALAPRMVGASVNYRF